MATDCRTSTLVTVCLDNAEALQLALPLILSFASVGKPPSVFFEVSPSSALPSLHILDDQLEQLLEFGVTKIFASESAKRCLDQHCRSSNNVVQDAAKVRASHIQAHAIYAF